MISTSAPQGTFISAPLWHHDLSRHGDADITSSTLGTAAIRAIAREESPLISPVRVTALRHGGRGSQFRSFIAPRPGTAWQDGRPRRLLPSGHRRSLRLSFLSWGRDIHRLISWNSYAVSGRILNRGGGEHRQLEHRCSR